MSDLIKELKKEIESIKKQDLTPVSTLQLGTPPLSPDALRKKLPSVLKGLETSLIAVDDDEVSSIPDRFSADQYTTLLRITCDACHTHDIKCTNGGLADTALILYYLTQLTQDGDKHEKVLSALAPEQKRLATQKEFEEQRESMINTVRKLLESYRNAPIDSVNILWSSYPEWLFGDIARLVKARTRKSIVSTGIEVPADSKQRTKLLQYIRNMHLECAVWYFPFDDLKMADLVDEDGILTDIACDVRKTNRAIF